MLANVDLNLISYGEGQQLLQKQAAPEWLNSVLDNISSAAGKAGEGISNAATGVADWAKANPWTAAIGGGALGGAALGGLSGFTRPSGRRNFLRRMLTGMMLGGGLGAGGMAANYAAQDWMNANKQGPAITGLEGNKAIDDMRKTYVGGDMRGITDAPNALASMAQAAGFRRKPGGGVAWALSNADPTAPIAASTDSLRDVLAGNATSGDVATVATQLAGAAAPWAAPAAPNVHPVGPGPFRGARAAGRAASNMMTGDIRKQLNKRKGPFSAKAREPFDADMLKALDENVAEMTHAGVPNKMQSESILRHGTEAARRGIPMNHAFRGGQAGPREGHLKYMESKPNLAGDRIRGAMRRRHTWKRRTAASAFLFMLPELLKRLGLGATGLPSEGVRENWDAQNAQYIQNLQRISAANQ